MKHVSGHLDELTVIYIFFTKFQVLRLYIYNQFSVQNQYYRQEGFCSGTTVAICVTLLLSEPRRDFQQCGILTSVDSDETVPPRFKLRNSIWCSVISLTVIEYSSD